MQKLLPILAIALVLSVGPGVACDPEEMIKELRAQCEDVIASTVALIEPLKSDFATTERTAVDARVKEAKSMCDADKYSEGYAMAAKLARFVGHVEARKGVTPSL
jgi:hypothetical protein